MELTQSWKTFITNEKIIICNNYVKTKLNLAYHDRRRINTDIIFVCILIGRDGLFYIIT